MIIQNFVLKILQKIIKMCRLIVYSYKKPRSEFCGLAGTKMVRSIGNILELDL